MAIEHEARIGVIGGSGIYQMEGADHVAEIEVKTPFGETSDKIVIVDVSGVRCAFLPRHGKGHRITPSEVNSRANIYAMKSLGVQQIISLSACGSLKEDIKPRDIVLPDQLFDRTKGRPSTFFGGGIVAHVGIADPFCIEMRDIIHKGLGELGFRHRFGGTYVCIEGPQFSTKAESHVNRDLGFSIVGMTALPEAKLAREAEICYATIGLVTDYDVWKEGEEVTLDTVMGHMQANVSNSKKLIKHVIEKLDARPRNCACQHALKHSIVTSHDMISEQTKEKLKLLISKYVRN